MIWDRLMDWMLERVADLQGLLTFPPPPAWVSEGQQYVREVMDIAGQLCNWVPIEALGVSVGVVFAAWVAATAIHVARLVISVITLGGGAV